MHDKLSKWIEDERAVSPVIGVILMVAITVILAAVIGTFVLDLGQSTGEKTPQVSFGFEFNPDGNSKVVITHEGGDTIGSDNTAELRVFIDGTADTDSPWFSGTTDVEAGSQYTTADTVASGDEIRVIWESNSGKTQVVGEFTVP